MCPKTCEEFLRLETNCMAFEDPSCNDENCAFWAHSGLCVEGEDQKYMEEMCPEHCLPEPFRYTKNCQAWDDPECSDESCEEYANEGECLEDPDYMGPMCPIACEEILEAAR